MRTVAKVFALGGAVAVLLAVTGCINIQTSSSAGYTQGDYRVVTNLTAKGSIAIDVTGVEVENQHGEVRIVGVDASETGWSWHLEVRARSESVADGVAAVANCTAARDGQRLRIVLSMPENRQGEFSFQSDLEVRVPRTHSIRCRNSYGAVRVADLTGEADVVNQHGAVQVRDVRGSIAVLTSYAGTSVHQTGPATLKSQHGAITADNIQGPLTAETSYATLSAANVQGMVHLRNQHGAVQLSRAAADADLETSYASLTVERVQGDVILRNQHGSIEAKELAGSVNAQTAYASLDMAAAGPHLEGRNQHGSVRVRALSPALARLTASTSYASLEVRLPATAQPNIRAQASHGDVHSDFPVWLKPASHDPFADAPSSGARVSLENQHGGIRIVRE